MQQGKDRRKKVQAISVLAISALLLAQLTPMVNAQNRPRPIWQPVTVPALPRSPLPLATPTPTPAMTCKNAEGKDAKWGEKCEIQINSKQLIAPGTFVVKSVTEVTIVVHKSPFLTAKFDSSRTEVPPPPDAISGIISFISPVTRALTLASTASRSAENIKTNQNFTVLAESVKSKESTPETRLTPEQERLKDKQQIIELLKGILDDKNGNQADIKAVSGRYKTLDHDLGVFFNAGSKHCHETKPQLDPIPDYEKTRQKRLDEIKGISYEDLVSVKGEEANLANAEKLLGKITTTPPYDPAFAGEAAKWMNKASGKIQLFKEGIAHLNEARTEFINILGVLENLKEAKCIQTIPVLRDRQVNITGNVIFTNTITGKALSPQLPVKISFRDLPRASLSAGVLISPLEKRTFSTAQVSDGPGSRHAEIQGEATRPQVIPFSFVNVRLFDWRRNERFFTFNIAPGIGVNPNGGTNEVEFALGASLGLNNVYFFGGFHFGREANLINGFNFGDRVPDNFVPPVNRRWKTNFGFGISYRVPLP